MSLTCVTLFLSRARVGFPSEPTLNGFEEVPATPQGWNHRPAATPIWAGERPRGAKRRAEKARLRDLGAHCRCFSRYCSCHLCQFL